MTDRQGMTELGPRTLIAALVLVAFAVWAALPIAAELIGACR